MSKEDRLIGNMTNWISKLGMEEPAIIALETLKPFALVAGELSAFFLAPFLWLLDNKGFDFIDTFEKTGNLEKLIKSLEDASKQKKENP